MRGCHRPRRHLQALLYCLLLCGAPVTAAEWSAPIRVNPEKTGWFPAVAADNAGGVHVIWDMGQKGSDSIMYCSPADDACPDPRPIAIRYGGDGNYVTRASMAIDARGIAHLLWRRKGAIVYTSAPVQRPLSTQGWQRLQQLGGGAYNTIAVDDRGSVHAAWSEPQFRERTDPCFGCADIKYSRSSDGGNAWSIPINVSNTPASGSEKPHLAFGKDGTVYLAWEEGRDHYVGKGAARASMISTSTNDGVTWSTPVTSVLADDAQQSIAIAVDMNDKVVIVWRRMNGDGVYYQTSVDRGQSWSDAAVIDGIAVRSLNNNLDTYDMATDGAGYVHLVMAGRLSQTMPNPKPNHVLHLEWNGSQWSAPDVLYTTPGAPEWPRIAIGNGNRLNAVWFERPEGFEWKTGEAPYTVWYAHSTSGAAAVAPVPWPPLPPVRLSASDWWRIARAILAVALIATVITVTRRYGW